MAENRRRRPSLRSRTAVVATRIALAIALAVLALVAFGCGGASTTPSGSAEESDAAASSVATNTVEVEVGETYRAAGTAIRVMSAGPANLPAQMSPVPEGETRVAVRATFKNETDQALPLNAAPYSAYTTSLVIGGTSYPGGLFSGVVGHVQDGTIPAGQELDLRFVFEVPEGSTAATFVWPPAHPSQGLPQIEVPLADVSTNP